MTQLAAELPLKEENLSSIKISLLLRVSIVNVREVEI